MINILKTSFFLLLLGGDLVQAQTNSSNSTMNPQALATEFSIYVTIPDTTILSYVTLEGKPIFNNPAINAIIDQYYVTGFHQAFPNAREQYLKQAFQMNCSSIDLGIALTTNFSTLFPYYEDAGVAQLTSDYYPNEWFSGVGYMKYLEYIGAPTAWGVTKGDPNLVIGVTDTYFDMTNPDFQNKVATLRNNSSPLASNAGHGTLVAGLVAGATDNNYAYPSMGFNCKLDLSANWANDAEMLNISNDNRRVLNASWFKSTSPNLDIENRVYQQGVYNEIYENGTIVFFGAGNGKGSDPINGPRGYLYPASLNHNFAVTHVGWESPYGGSSIFNVEDVHEIYIGDTVNNCYHHNDRIDLCAPGVRVGGLKFDNTNPSIHYMWDEGWGTSFASPIVAGTAGLILSENPCLTPYQVEYILKKSAKDIYIHPENLKYAGTTRFNGRLGAGKLQAGEALLMTKSFDCNNISTQTFSIEGIEINSICKPGNASNGVLPKLTPILKNGTGPYKYHWYPLPGNETTLDDNEIEQPTIVTSTGTNIACYRLTVYDNSEIQKVADKIIKIHLTSAASYDLAMRDHYMDMMNEPNSMTDLDPRIWDVWTSPDIWNRQIADGIKKHENPEYFSSNPNYVYVRVRNIGCANSPSTAKLKIYWSKASTGEQWKNDWDGSTKVGGSGGGVVDAGGEITSSSGLSIPVLEPGQSIILSHEWFPVNPHEYFGSPDNVDVCFLGRIETSTSSPFGMTIPELLNINVSKNIKNNNNIVSRNMILTDFLPGNTKINHWVDFANASALNGHFMMELLNDRHINPHHSGDFSAIGQVTVYLGELYSIWKEAGGRGTFTSFDDEAQSVLFDGSSKMQLTGIPLDAHARFPIQLEFLLKEGVELNDYEFLLHFRQFDETDMKNVYGAVNFLITTHVDMQQQSSAFNSQFKANIPNQFMLYPNPAEDAILLSWKELASSAQIDILDVYGRTLIVLKDQLLNAAPVEIDISGLTPGIYFVNVRAKNGLNEQQKFIKK